MGRISSADPRGSVVTSPGHAAIYTRISDDPEGSALGVARQEQDCRDLAGRLGAHVVAVFTDNDVSASTNATKDRPSYGDMLRRARAGEFSHVIAYSNSRLTRRLRETIDLIDLARRNGVVIKTVASGEFDLSTADGRATALTLATWDQAEAERGASESNAQRPSVSSPGAGTVASLRSVSPRRIRPSSLPIARHR